MNIPKYFQKSKSKQYDHARHLTQRQCCKTGIRLCMMKYYHSMQSLQWSSHKYNQM